MMPTRSFVVNKNISVISTGSWVPEDFSERNVDQKYKVIINNLILDAFIGIHKHEKTKKQRVSISLSIEVVDNISLVDQRIENFLSYENVIDNIKLIINRGHIDLVETLSYEILSNILTVEYLTFANVPIPIELMTYLMYCYIQLELRYNHLLFLS